MLSAWEQALGALVAEIHHEGRDLEQDRLEPVGAPLHALVMISIIPGGRVTFVQ